MTHYKVASSLTEKEKIAYLNTITPEEFNGWYLKKRGLWNSSLSYDDNIKNAINDDANILNYLIGVRHNLSDLGIL